MFFNTKQYNTNNYYAMLCSAMERKALIFSSGFLPQKLIMIKSKCQCSFSKRNHISHISLLKSLTLA